MPAHERVRHLAPSIVALVLFGVALAVLRSELHALRWQELVRDVFLIPRGRLALAALLTALNYACLTSYDFLAFVYIAKRLPVRQIVGTSLLAYAISNTVGLSALSGASVRYRFYTRWGVSAEDLARIVFSYSMTFWLGLLMLGGISLAGRSWSAVSPFPGPWTSVAGWLLLLTVAAVFIASWLGRQSFRIASFEFQLPSPALTLAQLLASTVDWLLAAAVLFVLLPRAGVSFPVLLGAFLTAVLLGMISHVPGGLGVFEGLMVLLMRPYLTAAELVPSLVVFRAVYYLVPFVAALTVLIVDELQQRREQAARLGALAGRVAQQLTPRFAALFVFMAGAVLLFSGATPADPNRLSVLGGILPLPVIEASHFLGSLIGMLLLIVSHGLWRRLDAAYYVTVAATMAGVATALLKGFDYEEALLLVIVLVVLWWARPAFDRRAAFFDASFSPDWVAAVGAALGASIWLGLFAFKHVDYSHELWWQFAVDAQASRFLRGSVGAGIVALIVGTAKLLRPPVYQIRPPDAPSLEEAQRIIARQTSTLPNLVHLRDKALLFDENHTGFIMYGVHRRTWVALGDPVSPVEVVSSLIRAFLERCDDYGGVPVFYEIGKAHLHRYVDLGMTFVKLGEDARVDLRAFDLSGPHGARHRQALRQLERTGASFRVVPAGAISSVMGQLRRVSEDWLRRKATAEKGFSLGFFDERYLMRFPAAVVERDGQIVAFANIWLGAQREEISIDLMRFSQEAPKSVMEALLLHLMLWGKAEGYRWFALGVAPLSGFERSPVASLWTRLGAFLYEHGEAVYSFQGLRAYKERFDPVWEPRYLAYPGGFMLPRVLADVATLIAGGYRRILSKS